MWLQDRNTIYMNYMRNIVIDSNSAGDAVNKFKFQGGIDTAIGIDYPTTGPSMNFQTLIRDLAISVGERAPRVQIPLDDICSFLFHKFDTRLADKISVEIKFKNNPTGWLDTEFISSNLPAGAPIYPSLRVTNAFITQRSQLYTDPSILWNLSTPWMKPMIKTEVQAFPLGPNPPQFFNAASAVTNPQNNPLRVRFRLSDAFALHKRIIGMSLQISYADPGHSTPGVPGLQWFPNGTQAKIYKGGKLVEDLSSICKFGRQSDHFLKCLGANWVPHSATTAEQVIVGTAASLMNFNWNLWGAGGNYISFLDRNLAETNKADLGSLTNVALLGGISNEQSENWEVEIGVTYPGFLQGQTGGQFRDMGDQLLVYLHYTELLSIDASKGGNRSEIKVYS